MEKEVSNITTPTGWFSVLLDSGDEVIGDLFAGIFLGVAVPLYFLDEWRFLCIPFLVLASIFFVLARRTARNKVRKREAERTTKLEKRFENLSKKNTAELLSEKEGLTEARKYMNVEDKRKQGIIDRLEADARGRS